MIREIIMELTPLFTTFGLIALAELGDKTQLTVIALSARYDRKKVFAGVVLAFIAVTGLGVLSGRTITMIPEKYYQNNCGSCVHYFRDHDAGIQRRL